MQSERQLTRACSGQATAAVQPDWLLLCRTAVQHSPQPTVLLIPPHTGTPTHGETEGDSNGAFAVSALRLEQSDWIRHGTDEQFVIEFRCHCRMRPV